MTVALVVLVLFAIIYPSAFYGFVISAACILLAAFLSAH